MFAAALLSCVGSNVLSPAEMRNLLPAESPASWSLLDYPLEVRNGYLHCFFNNSSLENLEVIILDRGSSENSQLTMDSLFINVIPLEFKIYDLPDSLHLEETEIMGNWGSDAYRERTGEWDYFTFLSMGRFVVGTALTTRNEYNIDPDYVGALLSYFNFPSSALEF